MTDRHWEILAYGAAISVGIALFVFGMMIDAYPREMYPGQYAQVSPELQKWFREQRSPGSNVPCCSEADGVYAQEDIVGNHYRARFSYAPWEYPSNQQPHRGEERDSGWMDVPDDVVIKGPNPNGNPVVWWAMHENGKVWIRCYSPGAGL